MDGSVVAVLAVVEVSDREDEYVSDSESDKNDDDSYPQTTTFTRSGWAIPAQFKLDL